MKNISFQRIIFTGLLFVTFITGVVAQGTGHITNVQVFASQSALKGCDNSQKDITFTAVVTADGPCSATYKWLRSDGGVDGLAPRRLDFAAAGTKTVTTTWSLWMPAYEGWQAIEILQPNSLLSNKALFSIYCCKAATLDCADNPFSLTPCAAEMLYTFRNLVRGVGTRTCNPTVGSVNVSGAMNAGCYGAMPGTSGVVTYTSFYLPGQPAFRTIWGSSAHDTVAYRYYGACAPNPLVFPFPESAENHVYESFLIPVATYLAAPVKTYDALRSSGLQPNTISDITGWNYESRTGFIASTESSNYNNVASSKGLLVMVRLRSGENVGCYLLNNYDGAGTLTWKQRTECPTNKATSTTLTLHLTPEGSKQVRTL